MKHGISLKCKYIIRSLLVIILLSVLFYIYNTRFMTKEVELTKTTTIKYNGTYVLTGNIDDGMLKVKSKGKVKLVFDNLTINNNNGPAVKITNASEVEIELIGENNISSVNSGDNSASIKSKAKITISGNGTLNVNSINQNGIKIKNDLVINSGNINVNTEAIGEELDEETLKNTKGIKANNITINKGDINVNSANDSIKGKGNITINNGSITVSSGDDGISAEGDLIINNAVIDVVKSYEGLEGHSVIINNGDIKVKSSDDGINAAVGEETIDNSSLLQINGGNIYINCEGDGIDSNGNIEINDGYIVVDGPKEGIARTLDCDGEVIINGGTLFGAECCRKYSSVTTSKQNTVVIKLEDISKGKISVGSLSFTPKKNYRSFIISSSELTKGTKNIKVSGKVVKTYNQKRTIEVHDYYEEKKKKEEEEKKKEETKKKKEAALKKAQKKNV